MFATADPSPPSAHLAIIGFITCCTNCSAVDPALRHADILQMDSSAPGTVMDSFPISGIFKFKFTLAPSINKSFTMNFFELLLVPGCGASPFGFGVVRARAIHIIQNLRKIIIRQRPPPS